MEGAKRGEKVGFRGEGEGVEAIHEFNGDYIQWVLYFSAHPAWRRSHSHPPLSFHHLFLLPLQLQIILSSPSAPPSESLLCPASSDIDGRRCSCLFNNPLRLQRVSSESVTTVTGALDKFTRMTENAPTIQKNNWRYARKRPARVGDTMAIVKAKERWYDMFSRGWPGMGRWEEAGKKGEGDGRRQGRSGGRLGRR